MATPLTGCIGADMYGVCSPSEWHPNTASVATCGCEVDGDDMAEAGSDESRCALQEMNASVGACGIM